MSNLTMNLTSAVSSMEISNFGDSVVLFEPTAARCSSSSSTCCVGCVDLDL